MTDHAKNLLQIHIAVLLFGLSGLFGKFLVLPAVIIVLGRVFFASISMFIMFKFRHKDIRLIERRDYLTLILAGIILAVHWSAFFMSIKVSTVAIAVLMFSTYPLFITFMEPMLFNEQLKKSDTIAAFAMFAGVILIVPEFHLNNSTTIGIIWGMACSVTFAMLTLINRKYARKYDGSIVAFYEQSSAAIVLLPALYLVNFTANTKDVLLLVLLGVVFTAAAHSMFISGMKTIKAQSAAMISSLESVYGIIAAAISLGEIPSERELIGGVIILGAALYSTLKSSK